MRVLYFSNSYTTHDRNFLTALASQHDIYFLQLNPSKALDSRSLPDHVKKVDWPTSHTPIHTHEQLLTLMPEFALLLSLLKPDLVHAGPILSCGFMVALSGFEPFVAMSWGSDILVEADQDSLSRWIATFTLRNSQALICDCQAVKNKVQKFVSYEDERVLQFPWGTDLKRFHPGPSTLRLPETFATPGSFIVLSTRSWEKIYGIDILLEAFLKAQRQNSLLRLILLGDGSLSPWVDEFIERHKLGSFVYRPGRITHDQLPDYFRLAHLYVSCCFSDGTSVSLLEAMASGLPSIVTNAYGNREWVQNNSNGWLAESGDTDSFATAMLKGSKLSAPERQDLAQRARGIAEARADWPKNISILLDGFDRLFNAKSLR